MLCGLLGLSSCGEERGEGLKKAPGSGGSGDAQPGEPWTEGERALLSSLSLRALPAPPAQPSNRAADDPAEDEQTIREAAAACPFFAIEVR